LHTLTYNICKKKLVISIQLQSSEQCTFESSWAVSV